MAIVDEPRTVRRRSRKTATAELVLQIATAASGERELESILDATLVRLRSVVRLTGGSIAIVEDDELVVRAAVGPFAGTALGQRLRRGASRSWQVVSTREPYLSRNLQAEGLHVLSSGSSATPIRSWLAVPIVRGGVGIGLLEVDSTRRNAFDEQDVELLQTVVRALAGPIDLASRYAAEHRAAQLRDAFVGVISHELRTPITTIYGTSKMLRRSVERMTPAERADAIGDIEAEADRLRRLVEDLLVLSRAEGGRVVLDREPILLRHVVRRVVSGEGARWPDRTFTIAVSPDLPLVVAEETYVEQVMRNLLSNAAKYSAPGSEVRIEVNAEGAEVCVRVVDQGIGLGTTEPDRLFDLFHRAPAATRKAGGAGIGLFVCRELVRAMNGRIWAVARPEVGAEFGFALPALAPDAEAL